jgi:DNA-binding SARP family transcriptional activator
MDSEISSEQKTISIASEAATLAQLLESGLQCVREGRYNEGEAFLTRARQQLTPDQNHMALVLDMFLQSFELFNRSQELLLLSSTAFERPDVKQRTAETPVSELLTTLVEALEKPFLLQTTHEEPRHFNQRATQLSVLDSKDLVRDQPPPLSQKKFSASQSELYITCFGRFEVKRLNQTVPLCHSRKGQTIIRYLIAQQDHSETVDKLMCMLWPEDETDVALHKLRMAISSLRHSLNDGHNDSPDGAYILCKDSIYYLNPSIPLHIDLDEFLELYRTGLRTPGSSAVTYFEKACNLYTGPFLPEDIYAEWSFLRREQLRQIYLIMCRILTEHYLDIGHYNRARTWATASLKENHCDEKAYQQLMYIYAAAGQRSEAFRLYQHCKQVLYQELGVQPMSETEQLFQAIKNGHLSLSDRPGIDLE